MIDIKKRFWFLFSVFIILTGIFLSMILFSLSHPGPVKGSLVKTERDEIKSYYTSLHFDYTGQNTSIALENNVGYAQIKLRNYVNDDVTKRDIEYNITTLKDFYDINGNKINATSYDTTENFYVLDVWGTPQPIGKDSYKYDFSIDQNDGEKSGDNYLFTAEEVEDKYIGKTHNLVVKIGRKNNYSDLGASVDKISVVVQLIKPYKQVFIINMTVSNRLIVFSDLDTKKMDIEYKELQIQTASIFSYALGNPRYDDINQQYDAKGMLVTLSWDNLILNKNSVLELHNGTKLDDFGEIITGNPSNLDISKPYVVSLNLSSKSSGTLQLYIPQGSDFKLGFLKVQNAETFHVKVNVQVSINDKYYDYDTAHGGYDLDSDKNITVIHHDPSQVTA